MSDSGEAGTKKRRRESCSVQTAKKRELDRIAQKKSRERARNRMLELEEKLNRLQADDKQKQIADLMRVVEDLRKENERLRNVTDRIRSLTDSVGPDTRKEEAAPTTTQKVTSPPVSESSSHGSIASPDPHALGQWWDESTLPDETVAGNSRNSSIAYAQETLADTYSALVEIAPSYDFMPFSNITTFDAALSIGTPGQIYLTKTATVVPDDEKWVTSNDAFIFGINTGTRVFGVGNNNVQSIFKRKIMNSHAAYKAILWGCDSKEEKERSHPLWLALRQVDEKVFGDWQSKAQKIAMMFVCHRMLLYKCNPCKETLERVPSFLRPRPSQEALQHPAVIDFLIWPGLRDRLVFSHKRYTSTGDFSAAFCEHLHFHWPFSDDDILIFDQASQSFIISPLFEQYAFELKNWTMEEEFFAKFGEMKHDIPSSGPKGGTVSAFEGLWDCMPMTA